MPNFDGTGPAGKGPQTGRRLGPCANRTTTPATGQPETPPQGRGRLGLGQGRRGTGGRRGRG
ncbi:DUF5320 domain-containing protein [Candidatus Uhrbacteria bacterium]|nr:DUF5320 domain-containing protein [Candidatus Uhrbacteria bacterium]